MNNAIYGDTKSRPFKGMNSITVRRNGAVRTLPCGFSFTTLLFGFWPSAIRGHWQFAFIAMVPEMAFLLASLAGVHFEWILFFGGRVLIASVRNEMLINRYLMDGWSARELRPLERGNHMRAGVGNDSEFETWDDGYGGTD